MEGVEAQQTLASLDQVEEQNDDEWRREDSERRDAPQPNHAPAPEAPRDALEQSRERSPLGGRPLEGALVDSLHGRES
jgi:hypothetical protein